jgi:hypothetical protein
MKTALELLNNDDCVGLDDGGYCIHDLELVAQRAREEMRKMAADRAFDCGAKLDVVDAIASLAAKP